MLCTVYRTVGSNPTPSAPKEKGTVKTVPFLYQEKRPLLLSSGKIDLGFRRLEIVNLQSLISVLIRKVPTKIEIESLLALAQGHGVGSNADGRPGPVAGDEEVYVVAAERIHEDAVGSGR